MPSNDRTSRSTATGPLAAILVCLGLAVVVAAAPAGAQSQSDSVKIDPGEHSAIEIDFRDGPTKDVSYDVTVTEGPNIDVMVLDNANYQKYSDGESFSYVADWSDLDTGDTDATFRLERHGTWWVVLDHTSQPEDGASPAAIGAESVTARYSLEATTNVTDEARDTVDRLPSSGAGLALGLVGTVALAASRREA